MYNIMYIYRERESEKERDWRGLIMSCEKENVGQQ